MKTMTLGLMVVAGAALGADKNLDRMDAEELRALVTKLRAENDGLRAKLGDTSNEKDAGDPSADPDEEQSRKRSRYLAIIESYNAKKRRSLMDELAKQARELRDLQKRDISARKKKKARRETAARVRGLKKELSDFEKHKATDFPRPSGQES